MPTFSFTSTQTSRMDLSSVFSCYLIQTFSHFLLHTSAKLRTMTVSQIHRLPSAWAIALHVVFCHLSVYKNSWAKKTGYKSVKKKEIKHEIVQNVLSFSAGTVYHECTTACFLVSVRMVYWWYKIIKACSLCHGALFNMNVWRIVIKVLFFFSKQLWTKNVMGNITTPDM